MAPQTIKAAQLGESVSPRIRALDALIEASLSELRTRPQDPGAGSEALLFIGNWNDALPRLLIQDAVLEPVDKIVWAVIKTSADPRRGTAFPSYAEIARLANVASEGTIARALAILRATRWMTLCGRARDTRGRYKGNVYALHDEPLSLADTVHLDNDYLAFMYTATRHHHARVALVAESVCRTLELTLAGDADPLLDDPIANRLERQLLLETPPQPATVGTDSGMVAFATGVGATRRTALAPTPSKDRAANNQKELKLEAFIPSHQLQNLKTVELRQNSPTSKFEDGDPPSNFEAGHPTSKFEVGHPQNLSPQILRSTRAPGVVSSSSSSSYINTTTTTDDGNINREKHGIERSVNFDPHGISARCKENTGSSDPRERSVNSGRTATNAFCQDNPDKGAPPERSLVGFPNANDGSSPANPSDNDRKPVALPPNATSVATRNTNSPQNLRPPPRQEENPVADLGALRWPAELHGNMKMLAAVQLRSVPAELRQGVLDVLNERLVATREARGAPIKSMVGYMQALCTRARQGALVFPVSTAAVSSAPATNADPQPNLISQLTERLQQKVADVAHWERLASMEQLPDRQSLYASWARSNREEAEALARQLTAEKAKAG